MSELRVLSVAQETEWKSALGRTYQHDVYFLRGYHALGQDMGEGRAHLFVYTEGGYVIMVPFLLRPIDVIPGLDCRGAGWQDATSVYGYVGPLASHRKIPCAVMQGFGAALRASLQRRRVVAVFSRLHPLLAQLAIVSGLGDYVPVGPTVSIDLTLQPDEQRSLYTKGHKYNISKLTRQGAVCVLDAESAYLPEVIDMYYETMHRVGASDYYFFNRRYFHQLFSRLGSSVHLFECFMNDRMICAGLFTSCDGVVQYHLSATRQEYRKLAPTKLLIDTVRMWAAERGNHTFHLGGGVGAREDSLFHFKSGFSDRRHMFAVWRWIVLPEVYEHLCETKAEWNRGHGLETTSADYFPAYRSPISRGTSDHSY